MAVLRALEFVRTVNTTTRWLHCTVKAVLIKEGARATRDRARYFVHVRAPLPVPLGIFTKSHVTVTNKGVQRVHEFLLQDQSARLLPKERVCNCLKKRIDKTKLRDIKYNEERKKRIIQTSKDAVLCGHALSVPSKLRKNVGKN